MLTIAQTILNQLLTTLNTAPDRLSASEQQIARRICHCTKCNTFWMRRKQKVPDRCPNCKTREWDRPFLSALIAAEAATHRSTNHSDKQGESEAKP